MSSSDPIKIPVPSVEENTAGSSSALPQDQLDLTQDQEDQQFADAVAPTLENNFGQPNKSKSESTTTYGGRLAKYITEQQSSISIVKNNYYQLIDESEDGVFVGFEIAVNNSKCIFEVVLFGDNLTTPFTVNNFSMNQLLSLGRGLTPGDVAILPTDESQDMRGQQDSLFPWLARYKDDQETDHLGFEDRMMVLRFNPTTYVPYKRIFVNIKNTDTNNVLTVSSLTLIRIVYVEREVPGRPPSISNRGQFSSDLEGIELTDAQQLQLRRKQLSNSDYSFSDAPLDVPATPPVQEQSEYDG